MDLPRTTWALSIWFTTRMIWAVVRAVARRVCSALQVEVVELADKARPL